MIRPITQRPFGILVAMVCLGVLGLLAPFAAAGDRTVGAETAAPTTNSVLDPSTFALIGLGLVGLAMFRRRSRRSDES